MRALLLDDGHDSYFDSMNQLGNTIKSRRLALKQYPACEDTSAHWPMVDALQ